MLGWIPEKEDKEEPQPGTEPWDDTRLDDLDYGDETDDSEEDKEEEDDEEED